MKRIAATLFGVALGTWLLAPAMATDGTSGSSGYATKDRETINQTPCGATGCVFDSQSPPHYVVHGSETKTATGHGTITENQICSSAGQQFVNVTTSTDTATGTSTSAGPTATVTGTSTGSQTAAASSTENGTATAVCSAGEFSQTVASTATKTGSVTGTATGTATITGTSTASVTGSGTGTATCSNTATASNTWVGTDSRTQTGVAWYITGTCTETDTATHTYTGVATIGLTATVTLTSTGSITSTASNTMPCSGTWTLTSTSTATDTCALGSQSTLSNTSIQLATGTYLNTDVSTTESDDSATTWTTVTQMSLSVEENNTYSVDADLYLVASAATGPIYVAFSGTATITNGLLQFQTWDSGTSSTTAGNPYTTTRVTFGEAGYLVLPASVADHLLRVAGAFTVDNSGGGTVLFEIRGYIDEGVNSRTTLKKFSKMRVARIE